MTDIVVLSTFFLNFFFGFSSSIALQCVPVAAPGFKKWGGKKGATIDYGGGKHVRVAHIASAKREPIFLNCWGPIFFGQTCARSAHSERVSASRFFLGGKHVRGAHIASA